MIFSKFLTTKIDQFFKGWTHTFSTKNMPKSKFSKKSLQPNFRCFYRIQRPENPMNRILGPQRKKVFFGLVSDFFVRVPYGNLWLKFFVGQPLKKRPKILIKIGNRSKSLQKFSTLIQNLRSRGLSSRNLEILGRMKILTFKKPSKRPFLTEIFRKFFAQRPMF